MILIVGLGNPGQKFKKTRHNIGFRIISELRKRRNFSRFKSFKKFKSLISGGSLNRKKIIVAKPQTFMNNSGEAVKILIENYKLKIENLLVIHDDIDLPLGKIRMSKGRGAGGHKGVQSVIDKLGTKNFVRLRVGIEPVTGDKRQVTRIKTFVLKTFTKKEEEIVKESIQETISAIKMLLKDGLEKAMQEYNK